MGNERLRAAMAACGMNSAALAERVEVDPKTVERWISSGRTPYRAHRWKVAQVLGVDLAHLWPEAENGRPAQRASAAEFVAIYPNRGFVPAPTWTDLVTGAEETVDLLVYAGLFWFDAHPDLSKALIERAEAGVRVRLLFGDPESPAVASRGAEEGIDMPSRVRMTLSLAAPLLSHGGIEIRLHATTLYASIYQADDVMLVNTHVYGAPAAHSPVVHIQRVPEGRLFAHYAESFERVWNQARALG
ncbi:DUF5919 domain-containing protein [Georgenia wangjunii]|uniref:DUF5919 domain-containing protein n=1 Tax=Georgenia wangjunii TaxID=3117730 RepID=UPI002F267B43